MTWSPTGSRADVTTTQSRMVAVALLVAAAVLVMPKASAQNNTAPFATGTNCADLVEPRRSACRDAFDPRTNPSEWQRRQQPGALHPPEPLGLGRGPATISPKGPVQPILRPMTKPRLYTLPE
jgi:hypothetical protein